MDATMVDTEQAGWSVANVLAADLATSRAEVSPLRNEVATLERRLEAMRTAMQNARQHLWGGNATEALGELSVALNNDRTRTMS